MANPILKSEIIENGLDTLLEKVNGEFVKMIGNLTDLRSGYVQTAQAIGQNVTANSNNAESLSKEAAALSAVEEGIKKVDSTTKMLTEDKKRLNEEARKYKKLTDEEKESVKKLSSDLEYYVKLMHSQNEANQKLGQLYAKNIAEIDIQKKSYNELYQTYNALKDALNKMTVEERLNSEAGKKLTEQSLKIRDTLNELQKSTGNYTLQVGKYRAAFDGLGYSFQQILREAPSALNLNQFFLAISNNIPQFIDQLKAFKDEQAEIKANLATMTEGTAQYAEQLAKVQTIGQKLATTLLSWQTLVLVGLLIIRNWEKIVSLVQKLFSKVEDGINSLRRMRQILNDINTNVTKSLESTRTELGLIITNLDGINRSSEEWKNSVERINEMIGSTFDYTKALPSEIKKATQEYLNQQEQIAKNKEVVELLAKDSLKRIALDNINNANFSPETITSLLGLSGEGAEDLQKLLTKQRQNQDKLDNLIARMNNRLGSVGDIREVAGWTQGQVRLAARGNDDVVAWINSIVKEYHDAYWKIVDDRNWFEKHGGFGLSTLAEIEKMRRNVNLLDKDQRTAIENLYNPLAERNDNGSGSSRDKQFDFSPSDVNDQYWKAEQSRIRMMEKGYDMEIDLQRVKHQEMLEQNDVWQGQREEQLMDNLMGELTLLTNGNEKAAEQMFNAIVKNDTEAVQQMSAGAQQLATKFWSDMEEGQRQHDLIMQGLIIDNNEEIKAINQKYDKEQMDAIQEQYKAKMKVVVRRSRTIVQEKQRNEDLAYNINVLRREMEALTTAQYKDNDSKEEAIKRAAALNKEIEKLRKQMQFDKQLSNYGSVWDIFQRNGAFEASNVTMKDIAKNLLGDLADSLDDEQIEQVYDTWLQNTQKAATEWYNTTMGYINDLISAYVELANAKAEAAAEATEAAQEEYDKEKALLEAGYASRVEATWAEYQERKAAQEQAEEDARKWAKWQQELNELTTTSNLITAAANIFKTLSALGPVGLAAAGVAVTAMLTAFAAAKIKAAEVSKFGEGDVQVVGGGSHASGHDTLLGYSLQGKEMRVENGEVVGIIPRRSVRRIGEQNVLNTMRALRDGTFEANTIKRMGIERSVGVVLPSNSRTDLHRVESDLHKLVSYGSRSRTVNADGSVTEYRKNGKVTIKKG